MQDRTPATMADLDQAAVRAEKLLGAVGLRDQARPTAPEATVMRRKAFALFMRVYAKARAVVRYLRAELGDADDSAPSLYAGRTTRRKPGAETPQGGPVSSKPGNDPGAMSRPSEQSGDDSGPAPERPAAAQAAAPARTRALSAFGNGTAAGVASLFGMLLGGRGPRLPELEGERQT